MQRKQEIQQKSRLGLLLINKGFITRAQLDQALQIQSKTDMRLGEVLVDQGWISERQLNRALKKQSRYRYAAAFAALLLGPIQPFMASANIERDPISTEQVVEKKASSLAPMSDSAMGNITAQGVNSNIQDIMNGVTDTSDNGESTIETLGNLLMPATDLLDADVEMSNVTYAEGPRTQANADGSINVALPTHIGQLAFKNVRVAGSEGQHFGDLYIKDIDLSNVNVTIRMHN